MPFFNDLFNLKNVFTDNFVSKQFKFPSVNAEVIKETVPCRHSVSNFLWFLYKNTHLQIIPNAYKYFGQGKNF